ncbi:MAG: hydroxyacylglutathione hydrolase [Gammaproteobacteria bacterium]|nr:MAG: hydroxyacylglutathione hydrolase [Gammaproteobacteria bacterium]
MKIDAIPAFSDNYIWKLSDGEHAYVVDPGDANAVIRTLLKSHEQLVGILVTHHHADHVGGVRTLFEQFGCRIIGPASHKTGCPHETVKEGDTITLSPLPIQLRVVEVPGHTLDHVAYMGHGIALTGDTLFAGGCGRLFEGSAEQMWTSLSKLKALSDTTRIYCAHEYTLSNLKFAVTIEPDNPVLKSRLEAVMALRQQGEITLPSSIELEKATNPFLRADLPEVRRNVEKLIGQSLATPIETFAAIRRLKDNF